MINEISKELRIVLSKGQDEGLFSILNLLYDYAQEPGITKQDIIQQLALMIEEIECYEPDPNDLNRTNLIDYV
jgi:hypothetical protein